MKNLSLILNAVLFLLVGYLYYVQFSGKKAEMPAVITPANNSGVKIAYVDSDTLRAKYEWLKGQEEALKQRMQNAENSMIAKKDALDRDAAAFQQKYQSGTVPPAQLEKEAQALAKREQALGEEQQRLSKQLNDDYVKTSNELMSNVEVQLKSLQSQIGYDYILSYTKGGGQVLLANDSLDITKQVLELLNAKKE